MPQKPQIVDTYVEPGYDIHNITRTWQFKPSYLFYPESLRGLRHCVLQAEADGKRIRATGSQHSFSNICGEDGIYLVTLSFAHGYKENRHNKTVGNIDQTPIDLLNDEVPAGKEYYVNIPGGLKVYMVNEILCPADDKKIARFGRKRLFNMGGGDVQAFAGALATGTHGSGGKISAYHDMVRSILIVASGGRLLRIEPENGITNKEAHTAYYADKGPDEKIELINDNDLFYSCLVSMGSFGIIFSVIIEVTDMNTMHEDVIYRERGWGSDNIKANIDNRAQQIISSRNSTEAEVKQVNYYVYLNPYELNPSEPLTIDSEHPVSCNEKIIEITTEKPVKKKRHRNRWPTFFAYFDPIAEISQSLVNDNAEPCAGLLEKALKAIDDNSDTPGKGYTDLAYKVWNTGAGELKTMGTAIEFAFPYSKDTLHNVMRSVLKKLRLFAKEHSQFYLNSPISIRFAQPSEAYLATNYKVFQGKNVDLWCYMEFTCVNGTGVEGDEREKKLYQDLQQFLHIEDTVAGKIAGRPHFGLNVGFKFSQDMLRNLYPEFDRWVAAYHFFNSNGTFDSPFTDDLRLRADLIA